MGEGERLSVELIVLMVLLLSIVGLCPSASESNAVRLVYVPLNLLDRVGVVINVSGNATDGF